MTQHDNYELTEKLVSVLDQLEARWYILGDMDLDEEGRNISNMKKTEWIAEELQKRFTIKEVG